MSGTGFTAQERATLDAIGEVGADPLDQYIRGLADLMREDFPGVDDALLARIVLNAVSLAKTTAHLGLFGPLPEVTDVVGLLARMAWVLAEVELETSP